MTTLARVLAAIADEALSFAEIAARAQVSKQWATACVRELRQWGWADVVKVESWSTRSGGRWRHLLAATKEGVAALESGDERLVGPLCDLTRRSPGTRPRLLPPERIAALYDGRRYDANH